jgi:hypothetical protein
MFRKGKLVRKADEKKYLFVKVVERSSQKVVFSGRVKNMKAFNELFTYNIGHCSLCPIKTDYKDFDIIMNSGDLDLAYAQRFNVFVDGQKKDPFLCVSKRLYSWVENKVVDVDNILCLLSDYPFLKGKIAKAEIWHFKMLNFTFNRYYLPSQDTLKEMCFIDALNIPDLTQFKQLECLKFYRTQLHKEKRPLAVKNLLQFLNDSTCVKHLKKVRLDETLVDAIIYEHREGKNKSTSNKNALHLVTPNDCRSPVQWSPMISLEEIDYEGHGLFDNMEFPPKLKHLKTYYVCLCEKKNMDQLESLVCFGTKPCCSPSFPVSKNLKKLDVKMGGYIPLSIVDHYHFFEGDLPYLEHFACTGPNPLFKKVMHQLKHVEFWHTTVEFAVECLHLASPKLRHVALRLLIDVDREKKEKKYALLANWLHSCRHRIRIRELRLDFDIFWHIPMCFQNALNENYSICHVDNFSSYGNSSKLIHRRNGSLYGHVRSVACLVYLCLSRGRRNNDSRNQEQDQVPKLVSDLRYILPKCVLLNVDNPEWLLFLKNQNEEEENTRLLLKFKYEHETN